MGTQRPLLGGGVQSGVVRFRVTGPRLRRDPLGRRHWSPLRKIQERVSERTRRRDKTALPCAGWRWRERLPGAARLPRSRPPRAPSSPRKKPMLRSWTYLIRRREHERSRQGHPDEAVGNRRVSLPVPRVAPPPARRRPHCAQAGTRSAPGAGKSSCPTASCRRSPREAGEGGAHPAWGTRNAAPIPAAGGSGAFLRPLLFPRLYAATAADSTEPADA